MEHEQGGKATPARLRRTPGNFVGGGFAAGFNSAGLALSLFFLLMISINGPQSDTWFVLCWVALFAAPAVHWWYVRISLTDQGIAIRRLRPILIQKETIYRVGPGPVPWGRGDPVDGIEIQTHDGQRIPLPYSEFLGTFRQLEWILEIEDWLGIDSTTLPLLAPERKLSKETLFGTVQFGERHWID